MTLLPRTLCLMLALFIAPLAARAEEVPKIEVVAELDQRPGNIAVALSGRTFVTMHPFDNPKYKLMELRDGKLVPFPNEKWSAARGGKDDIGIDAAIGVRAMIRNVVYLVDMGSKKHKPRLLGFTLQSDSIFVNQAIPDSVITDQSFMQDLAFDWTDNATYVADMGQADLTKPAKPAIIVIYANPFQTPRRVLEDHPSLLSSGPMTAEGKDIQVMKDGKPITVQAELNPITMDPQKEWLYYGPMGPGKIYRVRTSLLKDINLSPEQLAASVEEVADKPASDGMTIDAAGNIYLGNVDKSRIDVIRAGSKTAEPYIEDERLVWVDGFSFASDGMIYATVNQLNRAKQLNLGKETAKKPYLIVKFKPITMGAIGR